MKVEKEYLTFRVKRNVAIDWKDSNFQHKDNTLGQFLYLNVKEKSRIVYVKIDMV